MYVPKHFELDPERARQLIAQRSVGDLVTSGRDGLAVTFVPFHYDQERNCLTAHLARVNRQWADQGEAMMIVHGVDAYIGPDMVPSSNDPRNNLLGDAPVVPTLDYVTVHVRGRLVTHDDPDWVLAHLRDLVATHDPGWGMGAVAPEKMARMLRAIVGVELQIDEIIGKAKMSQNRSVGDITGIASALAATGHSDETTAFLREVSIPHAAARESAVDDARRLRSNTAERS